MTEPGDDLNAMRAVRDSVFLLAQIGKRDGSRSETFKVRNISKGGLMAEGAAEFEPGCAVDVELRNMGRVSGAVAWCGGGKLGVIFDKEIDPHQARKTVGGKAQGRTG